MNIKTIKLAKLKLNPDNPRTFTETNLNDMVRSLICFPEMYDIRPMAIVENYPIGGNLRLKAFKHILSLNLDDIASIIAQHSGDKTKERVEALISYWGDFKESKEVKTIDANNLTEEQRKEFVIKDNVAIGSWDYDALSTWDATQLNDWGVDVWNPEKEIKNNIKEPGKEIENDVEEPEKEKEQKVCKNCGAVI